MLFKGGLIECKSHLFEVASFVAVVSKDSYNVTNDLDLERHYIMSEFKNDLYSVFMVTSDKERANIISVARRQGAEVLKSNAQDARLVMNTYIPNDREILVVRSKNYGVGRAVLESTDGCDGKAVLNLPDLVHRYVRENLTPVLSVQKYEPASTTSGISQKVLAMADNATAGWSEGAKYVTSGVAVLGVAMASVYAIVLPLSLFA